MLGMLRAVARFISDKIGWHRIGFALSVVIIGVACVVLYRMLHNIDVNEVFKALRATDTRDVFLAALFVAFGYFTLTFYDLFALRTIGRNDVSYLTAALAGWAWRDATHPAGDDRAAH